MFDPIAAISTTIGLHRFVSIFHYFGSSLSPFVPKLLERYKNLAANDITTARIEKFNSAPTYSTSSGLSSSTNSSEDSSEDEDISDEESSDEESSDEESSDEESSDEESCNEESSGKESCNGVCHDEGSSDDESSKGNSDRNDSDVMDIEELHTQAIRVAGRTYIDPATGFMVFTEYTHLKRGKCCGSKCRHCPYGWENVKYQDENGKMVRKEPKVQSGDKENVKRLLDKIESGDACLEPTPEVTVACCSDQSCAHKGSEKDSAPKKHGKGGRSGGALTSKNVPYTRTGDAGTSVLITGERRSKDDLSFEAMGTVDELCSIVGTVHAELTIDKQEMKYGDLAEWLLDIMSRLFDIGSHIAKPLKVNDGENIEDDDKGDRFSPDGIGGGFDSEHIDILEECIDVMTEALPELSSFILPTGGRATTQLHVARCVCRRSERRILPLVKIRVSDPNAMRYLNRLSDFFFTAARYVNYCEGQDEFMYKRHFRGSKQRDLVVTKLREEK